MTCDQVRKQLSLAIYGELSFDEEERFDEHLAACTACRDEYATEQAVHAALHRGPALPPSPLLMECRERLWASLPSAAPRPAPASAWWRQVWASIRNPFPSVPALARPVGAMALIALGFFGARFAPAGSGLSGGGLQSAGFSTPVASRVRYVEPRGENRVQIIVEETRQRTLAGSPNDAAIRELLLLAARDPRDAGLRVESVDILKGQPESQVVRDALAFALQHDANPGVRLKALEGLTAFSGDPAIRKALAQVLLTDDNPGVRTQAIDLLIQKREPAMVGVFQELMRKEENTYVRGRCEKALRDMNASVETF